MWIQRFAGDHEVDADSVGTIAPGKRAVTDRLPGRGAGTPLPATIQAKAEASTGADLGSVRVHAAAAAHASARSIDALAFTFGHDIWFGAGQYQPGTATGDRLLGWAPWASRPPAASPTPA